MTSSPRPSTTSHPCLRRAVVSRFRPCAVCRKPASTAVHCICGQHCGQLHWSPSQAAQIQGPHQFAQTLGTKNSLKIKYLDDCERVMTGKTAGIAMCGALVEFSTRAVAGLAHG